MFPWNEKLQQRYADTYPDSPESLVDFGQVPQDLQARQDWSAEVGRFIRTLASRGYRFEVAMMDGDSGLCPLYAVRLDKLDFNGPTPIELPYFQWVVKQLCLLGQTTQIRERVLGIRVLPDERDPEPLLAGTGC